MKNLYQDRPFVIAGIAILIGIIFIIRLVFLQLINDDYRLAAERNALKQIAEFAPRSFIYDRKGELLVFNRPAYDLMVIPKYAKEIDTLDFCVLLNISKQTYIKKITEIKNMKYATLAKVFEANIPQSTYLAFQEKLYKFPGFYAKFKTERIYTKNIAAQLLGYVSEVDSSILRKKPYYKMGDRIGFSGIEKSYETTIRGERGVQLRIVDSKGNEKGSYEGGIHDTIAIPGKNIYSSIEAVLQEYGEQLMKNKIGSIVAIEPETGEILAMVSSPTYDPSLLVGKDKSKNYRKLLLDSLKPLFNRATMSSYPPGSTFKLVNGLIGLQERVITPETKFSCYGGYRMGNRKVGCHGHGSPLALNYSITTSCNAYYCNTFREILEKYPTTQEGYQVWRNYLDKFGLGRRLAIDFPQQTKGNIPSVEFYDKRFNKVWSSSNVISLAIGQGEVGTSPLQMANYCATIANRGYYYIPHVVHKVEGGYIDPLYTTKQYVGIATTHFEQIVAGMRNVVLMGTGTGMRMDSIPACGKTGTAENPQGKDHSIFIAFAPMDKPKIAIAVYVENAGFGATWAVPIARCMVEKYLQGRISRPDVEKRILTTSLIPTAGDRAYAIKRLSNKKNRGKRRR